MLARSNKKHIHKYTRKVIGKNYVVFACVLPECTHYLSEQLVEGKLSICHKCGEICQVRRESDGKIRHKPHHKECNGPPRNKQISKQRPLKKVALTTADTLLKKLLADAKTGSNG